jgi:hypothetical protein
MRAEIQMEDFRKIHSARFLYFRFLDLFVIKFVLWHVSQILLVNTVAIVILESLAAESIQFF